jgi:hypothetical protein
MDQARFRVEYETGRGYLIARAFGIRNDETVISLSLEVFGKSTALGLAKVLVDVTRFEGKLGTVDSYLLIGGILREIRWKDIERVAILDLELSPTRERFLELVARSRGLNLRIFSERKQALRWLLMVA